ncbi:MAG: hypothetical protein LBU11_08395 [Zoogloeaceae bacterium]|jgi:hypothetical protein|nr:hypothetical protein [Zoogloeaceae bacterium]
MEEEKNRVELREEDKTTLKQVGIGSVAGATGLGVVGSSVGIAAGGTAIAATAPFIVVGAIVGGAAVGAWKFWKHITKE